MKQTIEIDLPEGYEAIAYRLPKEGDMIISSIGQAANAIVDYKYERRIIIRKKIILNIGDIYINNDITRKIYDIVDERVAYGRCHKGVLQDAHSIHLESILEYIEDGQWGELVSK